MVASWGHGRQMLISPPCAPVLPIRIVKPLRDKTVLARHKATLECMVSHARGRVRWLRGDTEIFASDKYEICNLDCYRTLIIHCVGREDEDSYTCDAFDDRSTARLLVEGEHVEGCSGTGTHVHLSHPLLLWGSDPWMGVCAPPAPQHTLSLQGVKSWGAHGVHGPQVPQPPGAALTSAQHSERLFTVWPWPQQRLAHLQKRLKRGTAAAQRCRDGVAETCSSWGGSRGRDSTQGHPTLVPPHPACGEVLAHSVIN